MIGTWLDRDRADLYTGHAGPTRPQRLLRNLADPAAVDIQVRIPGNEIALQ